MNIEVNGVPCVTSSTTLGHLADERSVRRPGIAIAVNGMVIRATKWDEHYLIDGDAVEIVTAAAGG
jgi:sulfur carrier protein